jgi:hypothetical protein
METAGEGGAWGIALLADYSTYADADMTLEDYLEQKVFANEKLSECQPIKEETAGFEIFAKHYENGLPIEMAAVENFNTKRS